MENISSWIWVLIPLAGIAAGAFTVWVKANEGRDRPDEALEQAVNDLKAELNAQRRELETRVANLEAIVTSQTWDFLNEARALKTGSDVAPDLTKELESLKHDLSDARKAEFLARRIK